MDLQGLSVQPFVAQFVEGENLFGEGQIDFGLERVDAGQNAVQDDLEQ